MKQLVALVLLVGILMVVETVSAASFCNELNIHLYEDSFTLEYKGCYLDQSLFSWADKDKNGFVSYEEKEEYENFIVSENVLLIDNDVCIDNNCLPYSSRKMQEVEFVRLQGQYDLSNPKDRPVADFTITGSFEPLKSGAHSFKMDFGYYTTIGTLTFESKIPLSKVIDSNKGTLIYDSSRNIPNGVVAKSVDGGNFMVTIQVENKPIYSNYLVAFAIVLVALMVVLAVKRSR